MDPKPEYQTYRAHILAKKLRISLENARKLKAGQKVTPKKKEVKDGS